MDLNGSSWSEPDLGGRWEASVQFVIEVSDKFIVVLIPSLVVGVGGVSPPPVEEEAEEERHDESGVEAVRMRIENTISFE
jgi:hypothetical protein